MAEKDRHLFSEAVEKFAPNAPFEVRLTVPGGSAGSLIEAAGKKASVYAAAATREGTEAAAAKAAKAGAFATQRERTRRRLTADEFCRGDFVLYLEPTVVLFKDVTYDSAFSFGKPVAPFGRHPENEGRGVAVFVLFLVQMAVLVSVSVSVFLLA